MSVVQAQHDSLNGVAGLNALLDGKCRIRGIIGEADDALGIVAEIHGHFAVGDSGHRAVHDVAHLEGAHGRIQLALVVGHASGRSGSFRDGFRGGGFRDGFRCGSRVGSEFFSCSFFDQFRHVLLPFIGNDDARARENSAACGGEKPVRKTLLRSDTSIITYFYAGVKTTCKNV